MGRRGEAAITKRDFVKHAAEEEELLNLLNGADVDIAEVRAYLPKSAWVNAQLERMKNYPDLRLSLLQDFERDFLLYKHNPKIMDEKASKVK